MRVETAVSKFVKALSYDEKISIIDSFEQFERDGYIGEEPIRSYARQLIKSVGAEEHSITIWMNMLAGECYRFFACLYLSR